MTFALYCNCFGEKTPYETQKNQVNLMLNSYQYDEDSKQNLLLKGFVLDDCGDNISQLNKWFGQTCGSYWIYKNSKEEFVGTTVYRIFWDNNFLDEIELNKNKIYVPCRLNIKTDDVRKINYGNLENQFKISHGEWVFDILSKSVQKEPILYKDFNTWNTQEVLYPFSMCIAHREVFCKIFDILFQIAFDTYKNYKYTLINYSDHYGSIRQMDFICERIFHLIINNLNYYIPDIEVIEVPIHQYQHK